MQEKEAKRKIWPEWTYERLCRAEGDPIVSGGKIRPQVVRLLLKQVGAQHEFPKSGNRVRWSVQFGRKDGVPVCKLFSPSDGRMPIFVLRQTSRAPLYYSAESRSSFELNE